MGFAAEYKHFLRRMLRSRYVTFCAVNVAIPRIISPPASAAYPPAHPYLCPRRRCCRCCCRRPPFYTLGDDDGDCVGDVDVSDDDVVGVGDGCGHDVDDGGGDGHGFDGHDVVGC